MISIKTMNKFLRKTYFLIPILVFTLFAFHVQANNGSIDATYNTAKFIDTNNGTINFNCTNCNVQITDSSITGYAWGDVVGWINLNPTNGGVSNTINGILSGYAWSQNAGWINFAPTNGGVSIDTTTGEFNGNVWSQNDGWIKFDCSAPGKVAGQCVKTSWRPTVVSGGGPVLSPTPVDLCPNLTAQGMQGSPFTNAPPVGYMVNPLNPSECIPVTNNLVVDFVNLHDSDSFVSADAIYTPPDVPPVPLANLTIQAKVTSGTADTVEFSVDNGAWVSGTYNATTGNYEIPWYQTVSCSADQTISIKAKATGSIGLVTNEKDITVNVGNLPCAATATQCNDGIDNGSNGVDIPPPPPGGADNGSNGNNGDGLVDRNDPGCWTNGVYDQSLNDESNDSCTTDPTTAVCQCTQGLPTYNSNNPICNPIALCPFDIHYSINDPLCVMKPFCETNPTDPSCITVNCTTNPNLPGCIQVLSTQIDCATNPNAPGCNQSLLPPPVLNFFPPALVQNLNLGLKIAATISVIVGSILSLATALFLNPLAFPELILIPFRLWSLFLTAFGLRKRVNKWGTVYDSITKQPLDPVYVSLRNLEGVEVDSSITDIDGRYGFLVKPGVYKVVPRKTNYLFPSDVLSKHFRDEFYQDLYFGDYMNITEGEVIVKNIPLDPIGFDWNEFAKNKKKLFQFYSKKELMIARVSNFFFGFGFTVAIGAFIISPEKYNMVVLGLYVAMFILRRTSFKLKAKGRLFDKDGSPLSFAFIRVFSVDTNVEIAHKVTDEMGRYYMLVPNGTYYVKIEKKNDDASYSVVYTSNYFKIIHGVLNRVFNI